MDSQGFRAWRRARYDSQEDAAKALGVVKWTIHAWERGRRQPTSWRLLELACKGLDLERRESEGADSGLAGRP